MPGRLSSLNHSTGSRILFLLLLLTCFSTSTALTLRGKIVGIQDGDTVILLENKQQYKIRLASIDCPEKRQAFGAQSKLYTSKLAFRKYCKAEVKTKDRYGRYIANVYLPDGRNLNRELVRRGYAWHYDRYSYDKSLEAIERQARNNKLGLWNDVQPLPPWEFRKLKRK